MSDLIRKVMDYAQLYARRMISAASDIVEIEKLESRIQYTRDGSGDFFDNMSGTLLDFRRGNGITNYTLDKLPEHISDYREFLEGMEKVEVKWTYNSDLVTADPPNEVSRKVELPGLNAWEYLTEQVRDFGKLETGIDDVLAEAHSVRITKRTLTDGRKTLTFDYIGKNPSHGSHMHESVDHYIFTLKFKEAKPF